MHYINLGNNKKALKFLLKMYFLLFKFFKEEDHLKDFISGKLFCNTIRFYAKSDKPEAAVYDVQEGIAKKVSLNPGKLQIKFKCQPEAIWKDLNFTKCDVSMLHKGNIYCMTRFELKPTNIVSKFTIDPKFAELGDHYALIIDQPAFFDRLKAALSRSEYNFTCNMVEYVDINSYSPNRTVYIKDRSYSWQQELRFHFETDLQEPMLFEIGDIGDIIETGRLSEQRVFDVKI